MWPRTTAGRYAHGGTRFYGVSPVGLAAVAAALHVALFARRVPARSVIPQQVTLLIWRVPAEAPGAPGRAANRAPARPVRTYCAGQLALAFGMAVITLARWLQIMRINGARGQ